MDRFEKKAREFDDGILYMLEYYKSEYARMKNKMDDNHPYLCKIKQHMKELQKEKLKFKL